MGAASDPLRKNASIMNPMDLAMMKGEGQFSPDMTVVDVLQKLGIDPNGPASQLVEFGRKQVENGDMVGKMQNMAQDSQGAEPAPTPGLEGLLGQGV
jgi:hypothetical protein